MTSNYMLEMTDNSINNSVAASDQNVDVAVNILQSMREANESLRRTSAKIQSMEDGLDVDEAALKKARCRRKVNVIFYSVLIVAFITVGIYALCKFYFKIESLP